jgi:hypothetical protein
MFRMNDDALWERSFQLRPFAVDVIAVYGGGATAIRQRLARNALSAVEPPQNWRLYL